MAETGYAGRYPVLCPFYKGKWCVQDVCSNLPAINDAYKDAMELGVGNQAAAEIVSQIRVPISACHPLTRN